MDVNRVVNSGLLCEIDAKGVGARGNQNFVARIGSFDFGVGVVRGDGDGCGVAKVGAGAEGKRQANFEPDAAATEAVHF